MKIASGVGLAFLASVQLFITFHLRAQSPQVAGGAPNVSVLRDSILPFTVLGAVQSGKTLRYQKAD
jgi:hypothetical protein